MAILCNRSFCKKDAPLSRHQIRGVALTKFEWANRRPNFVTFEINDLRPNQLILVDQEWQNDFLSIKTSLFHDIEHNLKERGLEEFSKICFTGWGVGGAYATFAALTWKIESYLKDEKSLISSFKFSYFDVEAVTFGAPRIGNVVFAKLINQWLDVKRVTHTNDHVPHFPNPETGNYILGHHELEFWMSLLPCDCPQEEGGEVEIWECPGFDYNSRSWRQIEISDRSLFPNAGISGENLVGRLF
ncbi:hypothetical protein G9A89_003415 [Geosiphon pyriformis]|nr:hypothetical protein G9A89_003415 [Geosiphon pyriformis]